MFWYWAGAADKISVVVLCPGLVNTDLNRSTTEVVDQQGRSDLVTEAKDATHLLKVLVSVLQRVTGRVAMTAHRDHDNGPAMREVRHGPFCPCLKAPVAET